MHRIAVLAALAASLSAQILPVTSPKGLDLIEGNNAFSFGNGRRMMGIDNTLRGSVLPITAFGLRRNGGAITPGAGPCCSRSTSGSPTSRA